MGGDRLVLAGGLNAARYAKAGAGLTASDGLSLALLA